MEYRKKLYVELNKVQLKYEGSWKSVGVLGSASCRDQKRHGDGFGEEQRRYGNAPFESEVWARVV